MHFVSAYADHCADISVEAGASNVAVHLFTIADIDLKRCFSLANTLFTEKEKARLSAIKAERRLKEYLAGHLLARILVGENTGYRWQNIQLLDDEQKKPFASSGSDVAMAEFNISHSGDYLAIAICENGSLGLDIEIPEIRNSQEAEFLAIAERNFSVAENLELHQSESIVQTFYKFWTKKEAILKALGSGLLVKSLRSIDTSISESAEKKYSHEEYTQTSVIDGESVALQYIYLSEINCHLSIARRNAIGNVTLTKHMNINAFIN